MPDSIKIQVTCPNCRKSIMAPDSKVDNLPGIEFSAKVRKSVGKIYLSQIYGSDNKAFIGVDNIKGSIIECSCSQCHQPFPFQHMCECKAPVIGLDLVVGGVIKVCTRNGCGWHALEFENIDDAMNLFKSQDGASLF